MNNNMDIRNYFKRQNNNDTKSPGKKTKLVMNSIGNNFEATDYMVCAICIKAFKTNKKYANHMEEHQKKSSVDNISVMKVFKSVPKKSEMDNINTELDQKPKKEPPIICSASTTNSDVTENYNSGLYSVSQGIIKLGLPETFGVTIKNLASTIETIDTRRNLQGVSNITITTNEFRSSITYMSIKIRNQLIRRILQSPYYTLHLAEFLDIKHFTVLIVTVRYRYEARIQDEILFCHQLQATSADEIYLAVSNFMDTNALNLNKCVGISMDGVRAEECEALKYFIERMSDSGSVLNPTYTFSRRASFVEQHLPVSLKETLQDAVVLINCLKRDTTVKFERYMDDGYQQVFYKTDQYWLPHGQLLLRLFEMRDQCKNIPEISCFNDKLCNLNWLHNLAYLVDIIEIFRQLYRDLLINQFSTFHINDKINSIIDSLKLYQSNVEQNNFTQFPNLQQLIAIESQENVNSEIKSAILEHLHGLLNNKNRRYLPIAEDENQTCSWIRNPFRVKRRKIPENFSPDEKEMLVNLKKDELHGSRYDEKKLEYFWSMTNKKYLKLAQKAMKYLLITKNSQLSEMAFATLVDIRAKALTDLEYEEGYIIIKLTNIDLQDEI